MDFSEEITQLVVIIVVLLMAYLGINFWTKRGGSFTIPSIGGGGEGGTGVDGEGGTHSDSMDDSAEKGRPSYREKPFSDIGKLYRDHSGRET